MIKNGHSIYRPKRSKKALKPSSSKNNVIDIKSHEIRNPLSAILQSADDILLNIPSLLSKARPDDGSTEKLESIQDAAQTILYCAEHQKTIVDDILTLSKLDANLFSIVTTDVQPISVIQDTIKMFKGELLASDIQYTFNVDDRYRAMEID